MFREALLTSFQCPVCHKTFEIKDIEFKNDEIGVICPNCEAFLTDTTFLQRIETKNKIIKSGPRINNPADLISFADSIAEADTEKILIFYLSQHNRVVCYSILSTGTLSDVVISPRLILKNACLSGATGIVIIHNHPSGNVNPSKVDRHIVDILNNAFSYFDSLRLLDFIIVTPQKYWSMADELKIFEKQQKEDVKPD